jgi:hypothetical protein
MPVPLTPLCAAFVEAMNAHDGAAFVACFARDAVVDDEGQTHRRTDAVRAWIETAFAK